MTIKSTDIELLLDRLAMAARKRHEDGLEMFAGMKFDDFLKCVDEVGKLVVDLHKRGIDLGHIAMAADYVSRALALQIKESERLAEAPAGGPH